MLADICCLDFAHKRRDEEGERDHGQAKDKEEQEERLDPPYTPVASHVFGVRRERTRGA